jgi:hypothetical protein
MLEIKITNKEKFKQVSTVDLSGAGKYIFQGAFNGNVCVYLENGETIESDGEHGANDWNQEFGFIVIEK